MADLSTEYAYAEIVEEPKIIQLPSFARYAEKLWIRIGIENRPNRVGTFDAEKIIPRQWTGYYYVLWNNTVIKSGAIEFQNQQIFYISNDWKAEVLSRDRATQYGTPDLPDDPNPIDLFASQWDDEGDELAVFNELTSKNNPNEYFLPTQLPVDSIAVWFPVGVILNVQICWYQYSDIDLGVGTESIDLYQDDNNDGIPDFFLENPPELFPLLPLGTNETKSIEEIIEDRGYILESQCENNLPWESLPITNFSQGISTDNEELKVRIRLADGSVIEKTIPSNQAFLSNTRSTTPTFPVASDAWVSISGTNNLGANRTHYYYGLCSFENGIALALAGNPTNPFASPNIFCNLNNLGVTSCKRVESLTWQSDAIVNYVGNCKFQYAKNSLVITTPNGFYDEIQYESNVVAIEYR